MLNFGSVTPKRHMLARYCGCDFAHQIVYSANCGDLRTVGGLFRDCGDGRSLDVERPCFLLKA